MRKDEGKMRKDEGKMREDEGKMRGTILGKQRILNRHTHW